MEQQKQPRKVKTKAVSKPKITKVRVPTASADTIVDLQDDIIENVNPNLPKGLDDRLTRGNAEIAGEATKIGEAVEFQTANQGGLPSVPDDFVVDEELFYERFEQLEQFGVTRLENGDLLYEDEIITVPQLMFNNQDPADWEKLLNQFKSAAFDKLTPEQQMEEAIDLAMTRVTWSRTGLIKGKFPKKGFTFFLARWSGGRMHQPVLRHGRKVGTQMVPIKNEAWYEVSVAEIDRIGAEKIQRHMTGELIKQGTIKP